LEFQVRKCGSFPWWSLLFREEEKWENVCLFQSSLPPLKWVVKFMEVERERCDLKVLRHILLFNKAAS
jgi:hypothetical protein